jgi:hypothetical protein
MLIFQCVIVQLLPVGGEEASFKKNYNVAFDTKQNNIDLPFLCFLALADSLISPELNEAISSLTRRLTSL